MENQFVEKNGIGAKLVPPKQNAMTNFFFEKKKKKWNVVKFCYTSFDDNNWEARTNIELISHDDDEYYKINIEGADEKKNSL